MSDKIPNSFNSQILLVSQINFEVKLNKLQTQIGIIREQIEIILKENPNFEQNVEKGFAEFAKTDQEITDKRKKIDILNYLIKKLENGEINQVDDKSQFEGEKVAKQLAQNRQKEILNNSGIRNSEVSEAEIRKLRSRVLQIVKLIDPNSKNPKHQNALKVLNSYWELAKFGNNKKVFEKLKKLLEQDFESILDSLITEENLTENSTLDEINQAKDNELIRLEAEFVALQKYKETLENIITNKFGQGMIEFMKVELTILDSQIAQLKNRKSELEKEILEKKKAKLEQSFQKPDALTTIPKSEIVNTKEIPQTWEELGDRFDKIPDKYFTKFRSKKDELEIWKTERDCFCVALNNLIYYCVFPCYKLKFSPKYEPNRGIIKSFDERGLYKIRYDPEYQRVEFENLSAAYLELREFFAKFSLKF